ncbi:hypothetical protein [Quadrisphaera setariae]|uniref:DUF4386 family protein n=1 Tax=Quadrisphaera setariae TaxID=2593304 RepID=A0A5C8ZE39_9ACTN|nr:hypothetical protein [Quadrisphaera setariae]TXR55441.1 hypothetical protein FMM08_14055 [Quadrisphaera setariae]
MTTAPLPAAVVARAAPFPVPGAAAAAVSGALLLALTNALVAAAGPAPASADVVRVAGEHPVLTEVAVATGLLAALLLVPGTWAVAAVLARRTPRTAAAGAWLTSSAYVISVALSVETATALGFARSGADPSAYAAAEDGHAPAAMVGAYVLFGLGALVGVLVLGVAALRQRRTVPWCAGWALVLSAPVRVAGLVAGVGAGPVVASLLLAVGFAGVLLAHRPGRDQAAAVASRAAS